MAEDRIIIVESPPPEIRQEIRKTRAAARVAQIVDFIFIVLYVLIAIEIVLELTGARDSNGFKHAMDVITNPFLAPFRGLFSDPAIGQYRFMFSYLAALVVYVLLHLAIRGVIRLIARRRTEI